MSDWIGPAIDRLLTIGPPLVVAYMAWRTAKKTGRKVQKLSVEVDGRLTQLLESTATEAGATGEIRGRARERAERAADQADD